MFLGSAPFGTASSGAISGVILDVALEKSRSVATNLSVRFTERSIHRGGYSEKPDRVELRPRRTGCSPRLNAVPTG